MALIIALRGEEPADMRVSSTLTECKDGWVVAEEAMIGVKAGTMDGRSGGSVAPGVADACELSLEVVLKLDGGVLLNVRGDKGGAMGKAELKGEVEWRNASLGEEWMEGGIDRGLTSGGEGVGWLDMCLTLANDVRPVVGVGHG